MCRIAGIFDPTSVNLANDITVMRDSMKRGGPDSKGVFIDDRLPLALGHRRLSLLDLSEAGHQPMEDLDGQLQIVFNGEIYNFPELKRELTALGHFFRTSCDTEVILKAYIQWGRDCFRRFNGMFALAIFDVRSNELILARDHAGIKPLYYSLQNDKLFFASEIRAFTAVNPTWPENTKWKMYFLTFGHLPEPFSTLQNVICLAKGTLAIISLPKLEMRIEEFAKFTFLNVITNQKEAVDTVREKVTKAVERHLISDAPIGLFLSGGIDSSLLTLLAHQTLKENLHTISIIFEDEKFSEAKYQQLIIDETGAKHSSCLVTEKEFAQSLPDILEAMDQPSIDGINAYFICRYAHQFGLKAVLSGIGADELFGGYSSFYRTNQIALIKKLPSFIIGLSENFSENRKKKLSFLKRKDFLGDYLFNRALYTPQETAQILNCSISDINNALNEINITNGTITDARDIVSDGEQNIYMQSQLLKDTDYMGMWHGLEVRVPFLDKELMETVHSIDPKVKYDPVVKKHLLIKAFEDILPAEIYQRKKQGFTFPFDKWILSVQTTTQRTPRFIQKHARLMSGKMQWAHYWAYMLACKRDTIRHYEKPLKKVLFLNLGAFRFTGGIEKFNRAFLKALSDLEADGKLLADSISAHDITMDNRYFGESHYKGYKGNKGQFVLGALKAAQNYDTIIVGHINLSIAAWAIKKLFPKKQLILVTHGIEVWDKLKGAKNYVVKHADQLFAVSEYTKQALVKVHNITSSKISIFHNTIDPFFAYPKTFEKPNYLLNRYKISQKEPIVFTLTRLSGTEKYKGYDKVINVLPLLKKSFPTVKYLLSGKADQQENNRLVKLQEANKLNDTVILTGFIEEKEVVDHFLLADGFIMPSRKEGFGIVFIEAMACGLPVIAGNKDGSVDALQQGQLGQLIDPDSEIQILEALQSVLSDQESLLNADRKLQLQQKVYNKFGFEAYKQNLEKLIA